MNNGPKPSTAAFVARVSAYLAVATILSRLLGLIRDMLMARYYGASGQTDSFAFAIVVPELLRTLMVSGTITSIFIPLITDVQKSGNVGEVKRLAGMMLSFVFILSFIIVLGGEFFAPQLVNLSQFINPIKGDLDPERFELTVDLVRIMLPIVLLVAMWGLMGGILNVFDNFHVPGLAPIAWNAAIIAVMVYLGKRGDIHDAAWAFIIGHTVQVIYHLPALSRLGVFPKRIDWRHPMLVNFLRLAPAAVFAYAAPAVNAFIGQGIALNLGESFGSSIMYAFRVQQLPMSVFGVSVATALFPTLSRHAAAGSMGELVRALGTGIRMTTLATLPALIFFLVLPVQCIELIYQRGNFTADATYQVAVALWWFSLAMLPMSLLLLTARTFFSDKDTRTPAVLGVATIIAYYFLAINQTKYFGFVGLPMSNSHVAWFVLFVSIWILHVRFIKRDPAVSLLKAIGFKGLLQMALGGLVEAGALIGYKNLVGEVHGSGHLVIYLGGAMIIGAGVYLGVLKLLGSQDLTITIARLSRKNTS